MKSLGAIKNRAIQGCFLATTLSLSGSVFSSMCIDSDGDGWGWTGTESCRVDSGAAVMRVCVDSDGDGWGWDGEKSCTPPVTPVPPDSATCVDSDGDGWGWNGRESCLVSIPSLLSALNFTSATQCAEEDNINVPLELRSAQSYSISAFHPSYFIGQDSCAADFSGCGSLPITTDYSFEAGVASLYDDGTTVVEAVTEPLWWRPQGMVASVLGDSKSNTHYIRVYRRIAGTSQYPQILVLYSDGNLRIIPQPPEGRASTCFGTSVVVGPAETSSRPIAELSAVTYKPQEDELQLIYRSGGSAVLRISTVSRAEITVLVTPRHGTSVPIITLRSMYVDSQNNDASHLRWRDQFGNNQSSPIQDFGNGTGKEFTLFRQERSRHNTSSPDIKIQVH